MLRLPSFRSGILIVTISLISVLVLPALAALKPFDNNIQPVNSLDKQVSEPQYLYLPTLFNNYSNPSNLNSPFSIAIAAIHEIRTTANVASEASLSMAALENPEADWPTDAFPYLVDALKASGATTTRVLIRWSEVQPNEPMPGEPPEYKWNWYDQRLQALGEAGIQIIATIEMENSWAADPPCAPIRPEHMDAFKQFVTDIVKRYQREPYNINIWEIDNEPDRTGDWTHQIGQGCWGNDGDKYGQMLAEVYPTIKATNPYATVLMGGLAYDNFTEYVEKDGFVREFPDDVMLAGGGNYIDAHNIHFFTDFRAEWERWDPNSPERTAGDLPAPTCGDLYDGEGLSYYAGGIDVIAKATHYLNRMKTCYGVDKPLWITEVAAPGVDNSEESLHRQARYVHQVYARALSVGAVNITWYALTTPNDTYEQGLLYPDLSPKLSFYAYKTMTEQLKGLTFSRTFSAPGLEGYYFRRPSGTETLLVWGDNNPLTIPSASRVKIVDYLGVETTVSDGGAGDLDGAQNQSIQLSVSKNPIYITVVTP